MTILKFDGSLYAKQTYSILPGDLHKIYISAKIASEVLTPHPAFHTWHCPMGFPRSANLRGNTNSRIPYSSFFLEQLNNRHAPGAKSLKLGSNLGAQDILFLIRAPYRGVCASKLRCDSGDYKAFAPLQ
jgi:hypothetical protein